MPARIAKKAAAAVIAGKARGGKGRSVEKLLTSHNSPLATANLFKALTQPAAWTVLDRSAQDEILALLPDSQRVLDPGAPGARPDLDALRSDSGFRHSCACYVENVASGRHDPAWLKDAWVAHARRKAGAFDAHLAARFEEDWGVVLPGEARGSDAPLGQEKEPTEEAEPAQ